MFEVTEHMYVMGRPGLELPACTVAYWKKKMTRIVDAALLAFLALPAWADQVTIEPVKDNTLIERSDGSRSNALGPIFAGRTNQSPGASIRRACLAFDVAAAVPPGATITEVRLTLMMNRAPQATPFAIELHTLLSDWGEGTSSSCCGAGAPST
ncbi:MAG: hypothetical protein IID33_12150, partial [Planctomycetes bacterium]|nr:hypothetical protein [Planctomycetota bacterium]